MNPKTTLCWFCSRESAVEARSERVELYGNVAGSPGGLTSYDTKIVVVPRCAACARAHTVEAWLGILAFVVGGLGGIILYGMASDWLARITSWHVFVGVLYAGFGLAGGIVGVFLGSILSKPLLGTRRSGSDADNYPVVRELISRGWKVGSAPTVAEAAPRRAA